MEFVTMAWGSQMGSEFFSSPSRLIPTLTGTQYGTLDTPIVANAGDTVEIKFATTSAGVTQFLCDGDLTTDRAWIRFNSSNAVGWDAAEITALTIDGVAATNGVTAAPNDGKEHTIIATAAVGLRLGVIGASNLLGNSFLGQILSTKFTNNTTGVITNIVFDSGSTTDQPSRSGNNNVTLTGFTSANWNRYTLQRNITHDAGVIAEAWVGDNAASNPYFNTDTVWTKGAGWTISGGNASCDGTQIGATDLEQNISQAAKDIYLVESTISGFSAGTLTQNLGGASGAAKSANGKTTEVITTTTTANLAMQGDINFTGNVDNVTAKQLLEIA